MSPADDSSSDTSTIVPDRSKENKSNKHHSDEEDSAAETIRDFQMSLCLDNISSKILKKILGYVFPVGEDVKPWFKCGTSTLGLRGWSQNDENIASKDNVDVAFLRVSKSCYEAGTKFLYGANHFHFEDRADCCYWWLTLVGDKNVKKIKSMSFFLSTGWLNDHRDSKLVASPSDICYEENWFKSFHLIVRKRVQFDFLSITFVNWDDMTTEDYYRSEFKDEINRWRTNLVNKLHEIRNVKQIKVEIDGYDWLHKSDIERLRLVMIQRGPTKEDPAPPKLSFTQLLRHVKQENQAKAERIEEERRKQQRNVAELQQLVNEFGIVVPPGSRLD